MVALQSWLVFYGAPSIRCSTPVSIDSVPPLLKSLKHNAKFCQFSLVLGTGQNLCGKETRKFETGQPIISGLHRFHQLFVGLNTQGNLLSSKYPILTGLQILSANYGPLIIFTTFVEKAYSSGFALGGGIIDWTVL